MSECGVMSTHNNAPLPPYHLQLFHYTLGELARKHSLSRLLVLHAKTYFSLRTCTLYTTRLHA